MDLKKSVNFAFVFNLSSIERPVFEDWFINQLPKIHAPVLRWHLMFVEFQHKYCVYVHARFKNKLTLNDRRKFVKSGIETSMMEELFEPYPEFITSMDVTAIDHDTMEYLWDETKSGECGKLLRTYCYFDDDHEWYRDHCELEYFF